MTENSSIAIVVFNRNDSRYLRTSLGSVLAQIGETDELLVIDDQSTDNSVELMRSLIAGRSNARLVVNPENLGVIGVLNKAIGIVRSEYVLFLASNDLVLPGILNRARRCLAHWPQAGLWSAMAWYVDTEDQLIRLHPSPVVALTDVWIPPRRCIDLAHRLGNWFTGSTVMFRRDALEEAGGFEPAYMGMTDLFTTLVVASRHGAAYTPEPFAAIRSHPDSYLSRTLGDPAGLEDILGRIAAHGQRVAPELFTPEFAERTFLRFRFASVRVSGGATTGAIADRTGGWRGALLRSADRRLPRAWAGARTALAFLLLRPFDLLPTFWYRALGWVVVRARARWGAP